MHADSWRRNYRGTYSDEFLDGPVFADRDKVWSERLTNPQPYHITIVADDGGVIGLAHTKLHEDEQWGALLDNLHVAHAAQRRGIGAELLSRTAAAVIERAPGCGLYLWVLEDNTRAQRFYDAMGGVRIATEVMTASGSGEQVRSVRYAWADPSGLVRPD